MRQRLSAQFDSLQLVFAALAVMFEFDARNCFGNISQVDYCQWLDEACHLLDLYVDELLVITLICFSALVMERVFAVLFGSYYSVYCATLLCSLYILFVKLFIGNFL